MRTAAIEGEVAQRIVVLMETGSPSVLRILVETLLSLGEKLPSEQAAKAAQRIVDVMETADRGNGFHELARDFVNLGEKLPKEQAAQIAQRIVTAMERTDDFIVLYHLAKCLGSVSKELPKEQV